MTSRVCAWAVAPAVLLPMSPCAPAALRTTAPDASLRADDASASGSFSLSLWMVRDEGASGDVVRLGDLAVSASASGDLTLTAPGASLTLPAVATAGDWTLLSASWDPTGSELSFHAISQSAPLASGSAPLAAAPSASGVTIGHSGGPGPAQGVIGIVTIRAHTMHAPDVQDVFDTRHAHALFDLDTLSSGGAMNGEAGCVWMINHAITTSPIDGIDDDTLDSRQLAAVIGEPATVFNTHVYDPGAPIEPGAFYAVRPVEEAHGFDYVSHFDLDGDGEDDGFFQRRSPSVSGLSDPPRAGARLPRAAQLAGQPNHLVRVLFSGNSRAVRGDDGSGRPGTYAYGLINHRIDVAAGVLNSTASVGTTPDFGFDRAQEPFFSTGGADSIDDTDFSRFWTGSPKARSVGPGAGVLMPPGAQYAPRCRADGLMAGDAPLVVETYALRFPGASTLRWWMSQAHAPASPGLNIGVAHHETLNTQTHALTFDETTDDADETTIMLDGDHTAMIEGDAVVVESGSQTAISLASSIAFDGSRTVIQLAQPLSFAPSHADTIRFGSWGVEVIRTQWPALQPDDPLRWRGQRFEALPDGSGAVIFSHSAWRPDVHGIVAGSCGWSGNGYRPQLEETFPQAFDEWVRTLAPEVWLMGFAQQQSNSSDMGAFTDALRGAIPPLEIVWLGDMAHGNSFPAWHRYILEHAEAYAVGASTIINDPRLGERIDLYAAGLRTDESHGNARGNTRQAQLWLETWDEVALTDCVSDLDDSGQVGFGDLNAVLVTFGQQGPFLAGDVNADNSVDFTDVNTVLVRFGQSCD